MPRQTIYFGGTILTMEEPLYAEAMLVRDGKIAALGTYEELRRMAGSDAEQMDLCGHTLMPAFIDPHSHFSAYANALLQVPLGETTNFDEICERIRAFIRDNDVQPGEWVIARGYDHNRLREHAHPTRQTLDRAAPQNPLVLQHQSGHVGSFNTCALQVLGITGDTPSPEGGLIAKEDGVPTGYMEENAFIAAFKQLPPPDMKKLFEAYDKIQQRYASYGITTIQEGMMADQMVPIYQKLIGDKMLRLDLVGYPDIQDCTAMMQTFHDHIRRYRDHFKIGGYKIMLDGSPQGRTAWMLAPYQDAPDGYRGYPVLTDHQVFERVQRAAQEGLQILAHCNGDAASAQYVAACAKVAKELPILTQLRPVIVHAQLMTPEQLDEAARLGMIPSFFIAHIWHWGDVHIQNFGLERAQGLSRAGSALQRGMPFTFHQDAPVIEADMLETIWCAVCRTTRSGVVLGPQERLQPLDALRAVTVNAAYQYFEEGSKGSLAPGKRADLVILDRDPLQVPHQQLRDIKVLQTIKDGETIFSA